MELELSIENIDFKVDREDISRIYFCHIHAFMFVVLVIFIILLVKFNG